MTEVAVAMPDAGASLNVTTCSVSGCDGKIYKAGYCVEHFVQYEQPKEQAAAATTLPAGDASPATPVAAASPTTPVAAAVAAAPATPPAAAATDVVAPAAQPVRTATPPLAKSGLRAFGGGSVPCTICKKPSYPAETLLFETKPYHKNCFRCSQCAKRLDEQQSLAALYESQVYCKGCFQKAGLHMKQTVVKWTQKATTAPATGMFAGLGGGGHPCETCGKTVYQGEAVQFEGKVYHPKCLKCSSCSKECTLNDAAKFENKVYCRMCFKRNGLAEKQAQVKFDPNKAKASSASSYRMFNLGGGGVQCANCSKTVYPAEMLKFEDRVYHAKCFVCEHCKKELKPSQAEHKGPVPYCQKCYNVLGLYQPTLNPPKAT